MVNKMEENETRILNYTKEEYGDEYRNHIIEQYKTYLEMTDRISQRRQSANSFFVTLNTVLISVIGASMSNKVHMSNTLAVLIGVCGIITSYMWYRLIRSYKDLNSVKFTVIHKIEKNLPISLYDLEWELLGRGKDKNKYLPFTHIEILIPWVFMLLYFLQIMIIMV